MKTVREVSELTGVSVRALHYYDQIGLLKPTQVTGAGYRLYDEAALERLQLVLLYRELDFPLREIGRILDSPDFDRNRALERQIELLELKRKHLDAVLLLARGILGAGVKHLDFSAFDSRRLEDYAQQGQEAFERGEACRRMENWAGSRTPAEDRKLEKQLRELVERFAALKDGAPDAPEAQAAAAAFCHFFDDYFYPCTPEVLRSLGRFFGGGGRFTERIDEVGGAGTAAFVARVFDEAARY